MPMKRHEPRGGCEGAALVEFALLLTVVLSLLCGGMEMGLMFYNRQVLVNASREGARCATSPAPGCNPAQTVRDYCNKNLWLLTSLHGTAPLDPENITIIGPGGGAIGSTSNVTVKIDYDYPLIFGGILHLDSVHIVAQTVM